jgi:hypothetical protein
VGCGKKLEVRGQGSARIEVGGKRSLVSIFVASNL